MTNNDIIKGGQLMLMIGGSTIAFATSHSLSLTRNTQEISTKDHGDASAVLPTTQSWEITSENLMSTDGFATVLDAYLNATQVTVYFGMTNYAGYPNQESGIVGTQSVWSKAQWPSGGTSSTSLNLTGKGYITSATVNANAGENATMSITIQGSGSIGREVV
jgi:hypothetical protein